MKRVILPTVLLTTTLSYACSREGQREPRTPEPMTADGSGPSYNGPGTPWREPTDTAEQPAGTVEASDRHASAQWISADGYSIRGISRFTEVRDGVRVHVEVQGAQPGKKGLHIHQTDNCSDIPNNSMGAHFAPEGNPHGFPNQVKHHLGDLGNIEIDAAGNGDLDIVVRGANLKPGDGYSFLARSIVIHEADDKGTGESGDSGNPAACAPIQTQD